MAEKAERVLEASGFHEKTGQLRDAAALPPELGKAGTSLSEKVDIQQEIQTINASRESVEERICVYAVSVENPADTCYVSVDEIGVKHQK